MWILRKHDGDSSIPDKSGIITNKNLGDGKFAQSNHLQQFKQDVELSPRIAPIRQTWEYSIVCYSQFVLLLMDIYRLSGTGSSILLQTWCGLVCWKCRVRLDSKAHNGFPNVAELWVCHALENWKRQPLPSRSRNDEHLGGGAPFIQRTQKGLPRPQCFPELD